MRAYLSFLFLFILLLFIFLGISTIESSRINTKRLLAEEKVFYSNLHMKEMVRERIAVGSIAGAFVYLLYSISSGQILSGTLPPAFVENMEKFAKVGAMINLMTISGYEEIGSPVSSIVYCSSLPSLYSSDINDMLVSMAYKGMPESLPYIYDVHSPGAACFDVINVEINLPDEVSHENLEDSLENGTLLSVSVGNDKEGIPYSIFISTSTDNYATYSYMPIGYTILTLGDFSDITGDPSAIFRSKTKFKEMLDDMNVSYNESIIDALFD